MSLLAAHISLPIYPHGQREMSGDGGGFDDQGRVSGPSEMRSDAEEEEEEEERERRNKRIRGQPRFRTATTTTVTHSYAEVIVEALLKYAKIVSTGCGHTHGYKRLNDQADCSIQDNFVPSS